MIRKQESFTDFISPENKTVNETERGEIELGEENQTEVEKEITSLTAQESFTESIKMTPENQKRFEFDKSANLKLGGLFENKIKELTLDRAKKFLMENPGDFNLPESMAQRLTDEQIKRIVGENPKIREKIAVDPEFAEIINLHRTFKKAKGDPDTSEKILLFKTVNKLTSQPELIRDIQIKLLESMEGIDIDEKAAEALGGKDKHVKDKMETYKRENIERIMIDNKDREEIERRIDEDIEKNVSEEIRKKESERGEELTEEEREEIRAEEEGKRSALEADEIKKAIKDKKSRIEKVLGRSVTNEEIIFLSDKDKEGVDLADISSSGWPSFRKKIKLGGVARSRSEFDQFWVDKSAGAKAYFREKNKEFEGEWSEKLEKVKDGIVEKSLNEIPAELVRKIYRQEKAGMIAERRCEQELGKDKKKIQRFKKAFDRDGVYVKDFIKELGSKEDLTIEDFYGGVDGFTNEDFKKYAREQKVEQPKDQYSFLLLILKFIFGFIETDNKQK